MWNFEWKKEMDGSDFNAFLGQLKWLWHVNCGDICYHIEMMTKQSRPNINAALPTTTLPTAGPICIEEAADETFLETHKKDKKEK